MTTARDISQAIEREAEQLAVGVTFSHGKRHNYATIVEGQHKKRVTFASTPSDVRSVQNTVSLVRRIVRGRRRREPPVPVLLQETWAPPLQPLVVAPIEPAGDMLYHFTTSVQLPRILVSGELIVPTYIGVKDFIWA